MSSEDFLRPGHYFPKGANFCNKCGTSISAARDPNIPCVELEPVAVTA